VGRLEDALLGNITPVPRRTPAGDLHVEIWDDDHLFDGGEST
jgi:hypothetical protein